MSSNVYIFFCWIFIFEKNKILWIYRENSILIIEMSKKNVRFNDTPQIEFIINKDYYREENIMKDVWWSKEHYTMFRHFANREYAIVRRYFPHIMFKQSLQLFYIDEDTNKIKAFSLDETVITLPRTKGRKMFGIIPIMY